MDDMKQLIEKYKRELIEYSRSAVPMPEGKLEFPEMTVTEEEEIIEPVKTDETEHERPEPQVIGYSDSGDIADELNDVFSELFGEEADDVEGVSTVTPEVAERLDDVPQSGTDDDEQLGMRDFSEDQPLENSPDDIRPLEQEGSEFVIPEEQEYASLQEYMDVNDRRGTLQFRAYTARGALPVSDARIVVSKDIGGKKHVFYTLTTDSSGLTQVISLPAPPKELSETPDSPIRPFALYDAEVTAAGYNEVIIRDLPVFEGVTSVQRVALVPELGQGADVIVEQEPALNGGA